MLKWRNTMMLFFSKLLLTIALAPVAFGQTRLVTLIASVQIPRGVAVDRAGNAYIASWGNGTVFKVAASSHEITSLFSSPQVAALAVDGSGNVYFLETFALRKWNAATQEIETLFSGSPLAGLGGINSPAQMAVDDAGNVYIADPRSGSGGYGDVWMWNHITKQLTIVWIGFDGPTGVATDHAGFVYVADGGAIYKFNPTAYTTLVSSGLSIDLGLSVDDAGNVYIADKGNNAIKKWSALTKEVMTVVSDLTAPRQVAVDRGGNLDILEDTTIKRWEASTHRLSTLIGSDLFYPSAVAVDSLGEVYVTDAHGLQVWHPVTRQITTASPGGEPTGVAIDGSNNVFIADYSGYIFQVDPFTHQLTKLFPAYAALNRPVGLAVDHSGNLYVCIPRNDKVSKLGNPGMVLISSGLRYPDAVAVDDSGNVYVADVDNHAIKKWSASTQSVTTLVSSGLSYPEGVAVDSEGNVFIADSGHAAIKKWTMSTQQVTTLVSTGLSHPLGIAVDRDGIVYIADNGDSSLKAIVPIVRRRAILH
jgi:DNA-binding beta-propeller fold protein YncE